ncbi:MAG: tRNA lysidine(34) synthetase TilS [Planctomycetes bacterium]|nr:tRNA lysidine(34) synthetase TilS [Planctomycetota bacterium]
MSSKSQPSEADTDCGVPQALCKAWPPAIWRDIHVAVAISGGCDSTALLRALLQVKAECGGNGSIFALHVNHQLRGDESDQDAEWCQQQCDLLGVPLTILRGTAAERAEADGDGLEAAARAERYELLTTAAEQAGARYLAIAHTQNDQVETVLFRLLRGSGLRGLAGIPHTRPLTSSVTLARPLLDCCRADLASYLASLGQSYRNDGSNSERRFARNRVRHDLLPKLREDFNPDVDAALLRLATQADDVQQYLESQAQELLGRCDVRRTSPDASRAQISLALLPLSEGPSVVVCEALRIVWRSAGLPEQAMTYGKWHQLAQLAKSDDDSTVLNLPGGVQARVSAGLLVLQWQAE